MGIIKLYKETDNKKQREWFLLTLLMLITLLVATSLTIIFTQGSSVYYRANNALFLANILIFILFIGSTHKTKAIISDVKKIVSKNEKLNLTNYADIILLMVYATSILSFVFILDFEFMEHYGIKIGTVVALAFFSLLKNLFWSKK